MAFSKLPKYSVSRPLTHAAGFSNYAGPDGRVWGIRVFRLRELWFFEALLIKAFEVTASDAPQFFKRLAWALFLQNCLVCHSLYPGIRISIRRALGLTDYSVLNVWHLVKHVPPTRVVDPIIYANYEQKTLMDFLNRGGEDEDKGKGKGKKKNQDDNLPLDSWGEVAAANYHHKNILPDDFFSLSYPQLMAVGDFAKDEELRARVRDQQRNLRNKLSGASGGKAPYGMRGRETQ